MMNHKIIITLLLLLTLPTTSRAWEKRIDAHGKTIIAYYASWQWYDRNHLAKPSNLDHSKVTRYNFAFFQINEAGDIWGTDSWADAITLYGDFDWNVSDGPYCMWNGPTAAYGGEERECAGHHYDTGLISQAHNAGVEVYPSIGGWSLSDPFPALAANAEARVKFAENCVKLIEEYDFDGIDIDWEYPGYADHSGTPDDTVNYSLFLQAIRDALDELGEQTGRFYGLTAALPCGPDLIDNIQIDVVSNILTELNLMTYDFHGSWNTETGANAPLYDMDGSPQFSVHGCVVNWSQGGGRPDQINIGLPFYGRSFAGPGLNGFGQSHSGHADTSTWTEDEGSPQYYNLVDKMSQFTSARDPQTQTQYAFNANGFVSYDDPQAICDKTEYAIDHNLNGYIIWEISGDLLPDLSTPLLDATNDRLNGGSCAPDYSDLQPEDNAVVDTVTGNSVVMDTIVGTGWYPNQGLGYCVNDGKQMELFITADLVHGSAEACCGASFQYDADGCVIASLNPGANGQWAQNLDELPWYPHPHSSFDYCVKDGKNEEFHVSSSYLFSTAESCCDTAYSFSNTCLSDSKKGGVDGIWVNGVNEDDPWYPHSSVGACVADGNQPPNIDSDQLFTSAQACCDAVYSYNEKCLKKSKNTANLTPKWYPNGNDCILGSIVPSWVVNVYDSEEKCLESMYVGDAQQLSAAAAASVPYITHQPTKKSQSQPNPSPLPPPAPLTHQPTEKAQSQPNIPGDSPSPPSPLPPPPTPQSASSSTSGNQNYCGDSWAQANSACSASCEGGTDEECSGAQKCFADCTACSGATGNMVSAPGNMVYSYCGNDWANANSACGTSCEGGTDEECSGTQKCFADCTGCPGVSVTPPSPTPPAIVSNVEPIAQLSTSTNGDSKLLYYPFYGDGGASCLNNGIAPGWITKDMMKASKKECCSAFSYPSKSNDCSSDHPYYPNFNKNSCVNDGAQPDWMAGDYLAESKWQCCHNVFQQNKDLLKKCLGGVEALS